MMDFHHFKWWISEGGTTRGVHMAKVLSHCTVELYTNTANCNEKISLFLWSFLLTLQTHGQGTSTVWRTCSGQYHYSFNSTALFCCRSIYQSWYTVVQVRSHCTVELYTSTATVVQVRSHCTVELYTNTATVVQVRSHCGNRRGGHWRAVSPPRWKLDRDVRPEAMVSAAATRYVVWETVILDWTMMILCWTMLIWLLKQNRPPLLRARAGT